MDKINNATILDFYDLCNINKEAEILRPYLKNIPNFVRDMGELGISKTASLKDFAIIINKQPRFPIDSKANTWLSKIAYDYTKNRLPYTARDMVAFNLKKAADVYDLDFPDLKPENEYPNNIYTGEKNILANIREEKEKEKIAHDTEISRSFAIEIGGNKMFPLNTKEQVEFAKISFSKQYKKIRDPKKRHEMAQSIFEKCAELNLDIKDSEVAKYAGKEYSSFLPMRIGIRKRMLSKRASQVLTNLFNNKDQFEPTHFAVLLSEFDKQAGLDKFYNESINDAYYSVFCDPSISKMGYAFDTKYGTITEKELEKIAESEELSKTFDNEFIEKFKNDSATVFNKLGNEDKNSIIQLIQSSNIL